ncbi:MAG TPA: hypothetical protein VFX92_12375 [Candidatus Krumholzibacteria bacterium]|nr:hypothetical protein [Candidatus Krumholzibacteria bacterium]
MPVISTSLPGDAVIRADDGVVVTGRVLESVAGRILERFQTYFPGEYFDRARASIHVERLGEASSYPLFWAEVKTGEEPARHLIIKFPPVFADNNEGLTEFEHLRAMHDRLGADSPIRVPRALDFYADCNALVMERVAGERFSRVLLRDGSRFADAAALARLHTAAGRCGAWLAAYHEVTRKPDVPPFGATFVDAVGAKLDAFTALGFDSGVAGTVRQTAGHLHEFGRERRVAAADQHGDYGPQNVHVADTHIHVFDLNYRAVAPVYEDIDYFLVTLETMNPYPRQWFLDRGRVASLRVPFLHGYFGREPAAPERDLLIEGYYLKSLLFRCAKQRRNTRQRGAAALALFDSLRLRRYYARRVLRQCHTITACLAAVGGRRV